MSKKCYFIICICRIFNTSSNTLHILDEIIVISDSDEDNNNIEEVGTLDVNENVSQTPMDCDKQIDSTSTTESISSKQLKTKNQ